MQALIIASGRNRGKNLVGQYRLSGNASKWIHKFDTERDVTPATFEMTSIRKETST